VTAMVKHVRLDNRDYDVALLSQAGQETLALYQHATQQYQDATNMLALMVKARNAYIADLRNEMIQRNTGIDLRNLFSE